MAVKEKLRKKFLKIRKRKYFEIKPSFFNPLISLLKKKFKRKKILLSFYYPSNFETNVLQIVNNNFFKNVTTLLPVIEKKNNMKFFKWKNNDVLKVNTYGMLEPVNLGRSLQPNIILLPLIAFDSYKNRLGYGKGYYDRFLNSPKNKNILKVGVAFSHQKYKKLPNSKLDVKLDYILTEKGLT